MSKKKSRKSSDVSAQQKAVKLVKQGMVKAKQKLTAVEKKAIALVRKNPKKAAMIAAGIAIAVGAAAYKAMKKKK